MSIVNKIRAALENHLISTVGIPPVYPSNLAFDADPNTNFIKSTFVVTRVDAANRGLNPQLRYSGFFTMLVCTPEGNGLGGGMSIAETVLDRFAPTTDIPGDGIIVSLEGSQLSSDYFSAPFNCLPITVNWYIYHNN